MTQRIQAAAFLLVVFFLVACGQSSSPTPGGLPATAVKEPLSQATRAPETVRPSQVESPQPQTSQNQSVQARLGGTLTCNCPGQIGDIEVKTGRMTPRLKGEQPYRAANGEIAFMSFDGKVMISYADGSDMQVFHELKDKLFSSLVPAVLSPDGSRIAYWDSYTTVRDRKSKRELASFETMWAEQWTSEGRLLMTGDTDHPGVYLTNRDLTDIQRIDPDMPGDHPSVSPDGRRVALHWENHVWVFDVDGSNPIRVTASNSEEFWPAWSPDGQYLIVSYGDTAVCDSCRYVFIVSPDRLNQLPNSLELYDQVSKNPELRRLERVVAACDEGVQVPCAVDRETRHLLVAERIVAWW